MLEREPPEVWGDLPDISRENACQASCAREAGESPARSAASSLDTLQTSRAFADEFADAEAVDRYLLWRGQVYAELVRQGEDRAASRWGMCGDQMVLYCGAGHERWGAYRCELPFCPECARGQAKELGDRWLTTALAKPLPRGHRWVHVVLTLRAGSTQLALPGVPLDEAAKQESLKADYGRILKCWSRLRGRWKRRYPRAGGFASREVGEDGNVHIHILAQLPYIDQDELSREWQSITGDSYVVWISEIRDPETNLTYSRASGHKKKRVLRSAIKEACKYLTKLSYRDPLELVRVFRATRGTPRGRPWGKIHGRLPRKVKKSVACPECGDTHWYTGEGIRWLERHARPPPASSGPVIDWKRQSRKSKQLALL